MKLSMIVLPGSFVLAWGALALGFALRGAPVFVPVFVAIVAVWMIAQHRQWLVATTTLADISLVAVIALAAIGRLSNALPSLMLVAVVAALTAWDLAHLDRRLRGDQAIAMRVERADEIERHHVQWLLIAAACGLTVAGLAMTIRATLSFGMMFALGILAALALSLTIRYLRQGQQE